MQALYRSTPGGSGMNKADKWLLSNSRFKALQALLAKSKPTGKAA